MCRLSPTILLAVSPALLFGCGIEFKDPADVPNDAGEDAATRPVPNDAGEDAATSPDRDAGPDGAVTCVPGTEVCNGADDNCDGEIDEGLLNACGGPCVDASIASPGAPCSNELLGACARDGTYECTDSMTVACNAPVVMPSAEICNGIDDDCDGKVDEGVTNACGGCGTLPAAPGSSCNNGLLGACARSGQQVCEGLDKVVCDARPATASSELCGDNVDNDCDGSVDEADAIDHQEWYPDCDADGYAGSQRAIPSCAKPAVTGACGGFIQTVPTASTLDCNDQSAAYRPGAPLGVPPAGFSSNDLNCDGTVVKHTMLHFADGSEWRLCTGSNDVNCAAWDDRLFGTEAPCSTGKADVRSALIKSCFPFQGSWSCDSKHENALQYCN